MSNFPYSINILQQGTNVQIGHGLLQWDQLLYICGLGINGFDFQLYNIKRKEMSSIQIQCAKKYSTITLQSRQNLIELVLNQHFSISKAAAKLGLKLSTAKLIVKKYKETGTFFEKKEDRLKREKEQKIRSQQIVREIQVDQPVEQVCPAQSITPEANQFLQPIAIPTLLPNIQTPFYLFNYYSPQIFWV